MRNIEAWARQLKEPIRQFISDYGIEYLIIQNAFAIPMQLPLAQALAEILAETGLPALAHNHDFYWEGGNREVEIKKKGLKAKSPKSLKLNGSGERI